MRFVSTNNQAEVSSFREAVLQGIAADGGLFMPAEFPKLSEKFFTIIDKISFHELAHAIAKKYVLQEIPDYDLRKSIENSFNFEVPLLYLGDDLSALELFHGPTLAFKDFGARFMSSVLSYFIRNYNRELIILVATSGDTGSAVASGFYNAEGIKVILLYPSGKVSLIQEKQLTTYGGNITALEVDGDFDDCQRLVKQAFLDDELKSNLCLSSANSINIARLIPQSIYYFYAYSRIEDKKQPVLFSVPSGNLGNLTAGLIAQAMGLPVKQFIAAVNINNVFPEFLESGEFIPKPTIPTLSNAMDVGNPSNLARIIFLNKNIDTIRKKIFSKSYSDLETKIGIKKVYQNYGYVIDPHGAVGYMAAKNHAEKYSTEKSNYIILETAHPAKFGSLIKEVLDIELELPQSLKACLDKTKKSTKISSQFEDFKEYLLSQP